MKERREVPSCRWQGHASKGSRRKREKRGEERRRVEREGDREGRSTFMSSTYASYSGM